AGLGVGAGLFAGVSAPAQAAADSDIWSAEYWAKKGNVPLYIFRKRLGAPKAGESSRPVLLLVHGSSVTWRIFDLDTPGHGEYSMMNVFARWGFDVWTMDQLREIGSHQRQFRYRKRRPGSESGNAGSYARNRTIEGAFHG